MKNISAAVIVILGLFMIYFYKTKEPVTVLEKPPVASKPNVVSQAEPTEFDQAIWQAEWDKKKKIEMDRIELIWLAYLAGRKVDALDAEASYLEAYRDYKYYDHCVLPIGNIIYASDPVAAVMDVMPTKVDEAYNQLPETQKVFIDQRIEKCVSLTHFNNEYMHPERVRNDLKARMTGIIPESAGEKELAAVLAIIEQFEMTFSSIERLKRGENIDQQLFSDLWQQKRQLEKQYPQSLSLFGGYADADIPLVNQLNEQIKLIEAQIEANKKYDKVTLKTEQENFKNIMGQIEEQLINASSSDAYLAIHDLLNEPRFESAFLPIKQSLQHIFKLTPEKYSDFLSPIVTQLRACELGHPCGPDSSMSEEKCLDFTDNNSANACGLGILDYYLVHHLSPLQLGDVEFILNKGY